MTTTDRAHKIRRAFVRLSSIGKNIPDNTYHLDERVVFARLRWLLALPVVESKTT